MKIFYDAEFTGLHKDTTLISIALVDEMGWGLYAEFNDYDHKQVDEWIEKNVLENTINLRRDSNNIKIKFDFETKYPQCQLLFGSKETLKPIVLKWLSKYDEIELVSDVGHYDVVLLIDFLYGSALQSPICTYIDVNTMMANEYSISINEAFDISRDGMATLSEYEDTDINKHNALYDTLVLRNIYNSLAKPKAKRKRKTTKKKEN